MKRSPALALALGLCAAYLANAAPPPTDSPIVTTNYGAISGHLDPASHVTSFKGIPFAASPVGKLRWRPPAPPSPWKRVRDGSKFRDSCMQRIRGDFLPWTTEFLAQGSVSEDCLYLNVWTPRVEKSANLPVIVYIYGGGFTEGSSSVKVYDGTNLAGTGLVIVSINYRLGVFGFLAHAELTAESPHNSSGNYGLLDQIAALKWVQSNIRAFGGDPQRVTIWGQSAGAFSVGALLASPESKGLFERAMADSGLGIAEIPMPDLHAAQQAGARFAANHHARSIAELRTMPAADLLPGPQDQPLPYSLIIDGWVLPDTPNAINRTSAGSDVPVVTGYQANDGLLFSPPIHSLKEYEDRVHRFYGSMAVEFEKLYPGGTVEEAQRSLEESMHDRDRTSAFLWAEVRLQHHKGPVYIYFFDRGIPWPQHPQFGAFHTGEIPYFFRNLKMLDRPFEPIDFQVSETASAYLKAFATRGDPNAPNLPKWPAVNPASPGTMEIGAKMQPMPLADTARYDFWVRYFQSVDSRNAPLF